MYRWRRSVLRWGLWSIVYRFWMRLTVYGWDNIPSSGPLMMMVNHIHVSDPGVMISFYPGRDIVPLAKIEAFSQPLLRYFVTHWGAIPVHRGEADRHALQRAIEHIRAGDIVLFFAEGTRSRTGNLIQGKEGSAYLALKTGATVVPAGIWGTTGFPATLLREGRRTPVHVAFGRPFRFRWEGGGRLPREHFQAMTDEAMYRIAALLPPELRGVYSDLSKATTNFLDLDVPFTPVSRTLPHRVLASSPAMV
jgi:1-acyl-sn-glycerol-3-phosphate acyltransferase